MVSRRFVVILLESSKFRIILQNRHSATFRGVLRLYYFKIVNSAAFRGVLPRFYFKIKKSAAFRGVFE